MRADQIIGPLFYLGACRWGRLRGEIAGEEVGGGRLPGWATGLSRQYEGKALREALAWFPVTAHVWRRYL